MVFFIATGLKFCKYVCNANIFAKVMCSVEDTNSNLNKALEDVLTLKRLINESETIQSKSNSIGAITTKTGRITHLIAITGCVGLILAEFTASPSITEIILLTKQEPNLQLYGIASIAYLLILLVGLLYFILWRAAGSLGLTLEEFVRKNFSYLKNMNLLSDLFVKFCFASALLLAQKPEWFAAMLVMFTADYLIQGRFFYFSVRTSYLLGVACIAFSAVEFYLQMSSVLWPLVIFAGLSLLSLLQLFLSQRKAS